jgi:hypothetical protein
MLLRPSSIAQINWKSALDAYIEALSGLVAFFPLDDPTGSLTRVINPAVALGRELVLGGNPINASFWTLESGITVSGGKFVYTSTAINNKAQQAVSMLTIGKTYETVIEVSNYSAGAVRIEVGSGGQGTNRSANGTYAQTITCSGNVALAIRAVTGATTLNVRIVSVKQVNLPASSSIPNTQLLIDGNMAAPTTAAYTAGNGATLSKQPGQAPNAWVQQLLKIARSTTNNPDARQSILSIGNRYRFNGFARSDGTALPRPSIGSDFLLGTSSINFQNLDLIGRATSALAILQSQTSTGTTYTEWGNCSIYQIPDMSGYNGNGVAAKKAAQQVNAGFYLGSAYQFDGNDFINIYSGDLNSAFNPDEWTVSIFANLNGLTDSTIRNLITLTFTNATDQIAIRRTATNNQIECIFIGSSVSKSITFVISSGWHLITFTGSISNDRVIAYLDAVSQGSLNTLSPMIGNFNTSRTLIGASVTTPSNAVNGKLSKAMILNREATPAEILQIARYGGVT